ncbi:hypothetical protein R3I94_015669 [Phoxinus phoxinus]|uniref:Uncharacterized protein n=1 Tax=Phoxinus phoxinus TaxID=58324 RepID=A0AAN9CY35_9TELE
MATPEGWKMIRWDSAENIRRKWQVFYGCCGSAYSCQLRHLETTESNYTGLQG